MTMISRVTEPGRREAPGFDAAAAIEHIVFLTDMSARSDSGFDHARWLSEELVSRLTVLHGVLSQPEASDGRAEVLAEARRRQEREARESLERMVEPLTVPATVVVERLAGVAGLVERLAQMSPDLVVATTHGRDGMARLARGSVVETIVRRGLAPLLALREPDHGAALRYRRLLLPTDFSPASRRAFPLAAALAGHFGSEILATFVSPTPRSRSVYGAPDTVESTTPAEGSVARFLGPAFVPMRTRAVVEVGDASDGIIGAAVREHADIILLARHGQHGFRSRMLGGVAEELLRCAPCPVLVVP